MTDPKRVLVIIQFHAETTLERIAADFPKIEAMLQRLSTGEKELAFRSSDGLLIGMFVKTSVPQFIRPEFEKLEATTNRDAILVVEAGEFYGATVGFTRVSTWLQRH